MDSDLKRRVELFLQHKGVSSLPSLSIEVEGGQVILQGTVGSFYERQLCLCCQYVAGVLRVVDELQVVLTSLETRKCEVKINELSTPMQDFAGSHNFADRCPAERADGSVGEWNDPFSRPPA